MECRIHKEGEPYTMEQRNRMRKLLDNGTIMIVGRGIHQRLQAHGIINDRGIVTPQEHVYDVTCQCQSCLIERIRLLKEDFMSQGWAEYTAALKARRMVEARPFA